ncbi:MAG: hypothetical protein HON39_12375 [Marinovum sp.]|nr:hypothetical protein [Marinovum sp.]
MDWTDAKAREAEKTLRKWREISAEADSSGAVDAAVVKALSEDLNTSGAITALHALASKGDAAGLRASAGLLGLLGDDMGNWAAAVDLSVYEERLYTEREKAMETKEFAEVDRLKTAYQQAGLEVRISKTGVSLIPSAGFDIAQLENLV